ncbi:MAG TPA: hypothetical protein DCR35_05190 [Runella sp.]|nr:hypothetical protein [Runella sp.]
MCKRKFITKRKRHLETRSNLRKLVKKGYNAWLADVLKNLRLKNNRLKPVSFKSHYKHWKLTRNGGLRYSETIRYLLKRKSIFTNISQFDDIDGHLYVPEIFSLTENYNESFIFLKRFLYILHNSPFENVVIDYNKCERIDIDASVCMDVILSEFIKYFNFCDQHSLHRKINKILPVNYDKPEIKKLLSSIGSFAIVKGVSISFPDIIPLKLLIGDKKTKDFPAKRELHVTQIVDYIVECLQRMGRELLPQAETNLYKVLGEIIANAEEHSNMQLRYAIGYFQEQIETESSLGVFNFVIFNFGDTIYEKFKSKNCPNQTVVRQMESLSEAYTKKNFFLGKEFEEETLWTLYSLQDGVTSLSDWNRGRGSISFIESFFNLKGGMIHDEKSQLTLLSGNTRIIFDGKYEVKSIVKEDKAQIRNYKAITFNKSGDINDKPDKKYVTFVENYFPGTMLSAKIHIRAASTNQL